MAGHPNLPHSCGVTSSPHPIPSRTVRNRERGRLPASAAAHQPPLRRAHTARRLAPRAHLHESGPGYASAREATPPIVEIWLPSADRRHRTAMAYCSWRWRWRRPWRRPLDAIPSRLWPRFPPSRRSVLAAPLFVPLAASVLLAAALLATSVRSPPCPVCVWREQRGRLRGGRSSATGQRGGARRPPARRTWRCSRPTRPPAPSPPPPHRRLLLSHPPHRRLLSPRLYTFR